MLVYLAVKICKIWSFNADNPVSLTWLERFAVFNIPPLLRDDLKRERHLTMVFQPLVEANDLVHYSKVVYPVLIDGLAEQSTTLLFPRKNFNVTHLGKLTTVVCKTIFVTHNHHPPHRQNTSHLLHPLRFHSIRHQILGLGLLLGCH